jgi:hypothetical protein
LMVVFCITGICKVTMTVLHGERAKKPTVDSIVTLIMLGQMYALYLSTSYGRI